MTIAKECSYLLHINHVRQYPANIFVRNFNLENEIDKRTFFVVSIPLQSCPVRNIGFFSTL